MDLLIVAFGAFGYVQFFKLMASFTPVLVTDRSYLIAAFIAGAVIAGFLQLDGSGGYWVSVASAGFGVVVILLEIFRLISVAVDVQRTRVLLAAQQSRRVPGS